MTTSSMGFELMASEASNVVAPAGGWLAPNRTMSAPVAHAPMCDRHRKERPKYVAFLRANSDHFSGRSSCAKMADTGQTGTRTPQSIHSTESMKSC